MLNQNLIEEPLAVYNSFQFAPNNKINLALDLTIPLFAFDNGDNNKAYAFYIRPNIGNIKPWFTTYGEFTSAYGIDHKPGTTLVKIFQKRFPPFSFNFSMLKIYWNINNKKQCQIATQLQAASNQTVLKISKKEVQYSNWGKVTIPGQCLMMDKTNKVSLVISVPSLHKNDLVTQHSYQEFYLNFNYKKHLWKQITKLEGVIQYKNYDESCNQFNTFADIFTHYFKLISDDIINTPKIKHLFALRSSSVFNDLGIADFPIDFYAKIAKLWIFFNNQHLLIPTTTTIISNQTKYNFKTLQGYLKYNQKTKLYEHFFNENTVYNHVKNQVELALTNKLELNHFLVNPFLLQSKITFITIIESFNFRIVQNILFKPRIPQINIRNNFLSNSNWFKCLTLTYHIKILELSNYYNKEFTQELLTQFEFDFLIGQKVIKDEEMI